MTCCKCGLRGLLLARLQAMISELQAIRDIIASAHGDPEAVAQANYTIVAVKQLLEKLEKLDCKNRARDGPRPRLSSPSQ